MALSGLGVDIFLLLGLQQHAVRLDTDKTLLPELPCSQSVLVCSRSVPFSLYGWTPAGFSQLYTL